MTAYHATGGIQRDLGHLIMMDVAYVGSFGRHLSEVRDLQEGRFLTWIKHEFDWSYQTAYRFIHTYEAFGNADLTTLSNAPLDISSLYLLAAPSTPEVPVVFVTRLSQSLLRQHDARSWSRPISSRLLIGRPRAVARW